MRVLCLDIEGGYGGSSRSLYESVRHLPGDVTVEVWCRKAGPIQDYYGKLGVPCRVTPDMPHVSTLPRFSRNLVELSRFLGPWRRSLGFRKDLADACRRFDVVHLNHDGLFLLARDLRSRVGATQAITMHIRNFLPPTVFSRWQYAVAARAVDHVAFISENERDRFAKLARRQVPGTVIYNIASRPGTPPVADAKLARDKRFKVAVLSNYSWERGLDRLVDVAHLLHLRGRDDILFVVAGNMTLPRSLPGIIGATARQGGTLEDFAREQGVGHMFMFAGHVPETVPLLRACDMLAKPTREYNPWGRDILEAMAFGKPAIGIGSYDRFIENDVTGILHAEFEASRWADEIVRLADDATVCKRLGSAAARRVRELCDGQARARDLAEMWKAAAAGRQDAR